MDDFLHSQLFKVGAALVAAVIIGRIAWRLLFPPKAGPLHLRVRCASCGWRGTVGKYTKRCSKCSATTLEVEKK